MVSYFKAKLDVKRDAGDIRRERELMDVDLERRIDSLLGGRRYLGQRPGSDERERNNAMDKAESLVRYIDETDGIVREVRERECNARTKAVGGISEDIADMGKELERYQGKVGTDGAALRPPRSRYAGTPLISTG